MVKRIALFLCLQVSCFGGMTNVFREMFDSQTVYNAGNPGQFTVVNSGSLYRHPVGPRTNSVAAPGYSANGHGEFFSAYWDVPTNTQSNGCLGAWIRVSSTAGDVNNSPVALALTTSGSAPYLQVGPSSGGKWYVEHSSYGKQVVGSYSLHTWYWLMIEWLRNSTTLVWQVSTTDLSSNKAIFYVTNRTTVSTQPRAWICQRSTFASPTQSIWRGRIGGASVSIIGAIGDGAPPSDILSPVQTPASWHFDSISGNDSNSGLSGSPWQTVGQFNNFNTWGVILGSDSPGQGDRVYLDGVFDVASTQMLPTAPGITIDSGNAGLAEIKSWKDISGPGVTWTQYDAGNYPNIWTTTDGSATDLTSVVIWENDKWMNHPMGANIAGVRASLNTTAGSFFSDGSNLYLHPFGDTNPNNDGKTFTRSRNIASGGSVVYSTSSNPTIKNLLIRKTALARSTDNDPASGYGLQVDGASGLGVGLFSNIWTVANSKHGIGFTDSSSNRDFTVVDCHSEQSSPYANSSPFVDFNGNNSATGNKTLYQRCVSMAPFGLIGSTNGFVAETTAYISHNNGTGQQFLSLIFDSCTLNGAVSLSGADYAAAFTNSTIGGNPGGSGQGASIIRADRCTITELPLSCNNSGLSCTVSNCLLLFRYAHFNGSSGALCSGTNIYVCNTFDTSLYSASDTVNFGLFKRGGLATFVFTNNVFIVPAGKSFTVLENGTNTDTLLFDHNIYLTTGAALIKNYQGSDRNFAQWQALGFDTHSVNTNPCLSATSYRPYAKTPCWTTGAELGPATDITGKLFQSRKTCGAYEFAIPDL